MIAGAGKVGTVVKNGRAAVETAFESALAGVGAPIVTTIVRAGATVVVWCEKGRILLQSFGGCLGRREHTCVGLRAPVVLVWCPDRLYSHCDS